MATKYIKESSRCNVFVRSRPLSENNKGTTSVLTFPSAKELTVKDTKQETTYKFDRVFSSEATNAEVCKEVCQPLIDTFINGCNACFMVYGQTGSGKTHTILSVNGLVPQTIERVFDIINNNDEFSYTLCISYLQIYQDKIYDLLYNSHAGALKLREHPKEGVVVEGLYEEVITTIERATHLLELGRKKLIVAETSMVRHSSRSHSLCMLKVERTKKIIETKRTNESNENIKTTKMEEDVCDLTAVPNIECLKGKLYLCDLAGSERLKKTQVSGKRLVEARYINTSLLELGNVIHALAARNNPHIPFRNSTLTRLLKESLGGNSKASLMICVSPSIKDLKETKCSLNFGQRAMKVMKHSIPNVHIDYKALSEYLSSKLKELESAYKLERDSLRQLKQKYQRSPSEALMDSSTESSPAHVRKLSVLFEEASDYMNDSINDSALISHQSDISEPSIITDDEIDQETVFPQDIFPQDDTEMGNSNEQYTSSKVTDIQENNNSELFLPKSELSLKQQKVDKEGSNGLTFNSQDNYERRNSEIEQHDSDSEHRNSGIEHRDSGIQTDAEEEIKTHQRSSSTSSVQTDICNSIASHSRSNSSVQTDFVICNTREQYSSSTSSVQTDFDICNTREQYSSSTSSVQTEFDIWCSTAAKSNSTSFQSVQTDFDISNLAALHSNSFSVQTETNGSEIAVQAKFFDKNNQIDKINQINMSSEHRKHSKNITTTAHSYHDNQSALITQGHNNNSDSATINNNVDVTNQNCSELLPNEKCNSFVDGPLSTNDRDFSCSSNVNNPFTSENDTICEKQKQEANLLNEIEFSSNQLSAESKENALYSPVKEGIKNKFIGTENKIFEETPSLDNIETVVVDDTLLENNKDIEAVSDNLKTSAVDCSSKHIDSMLPNTENDTIDTEITIKGELDDNDNKTYQSIEKEEYSSYKVFNEKLVVAERIKYPQGDKLINIREKKGAININSDTERNKGVIDQRISETDNKSDRSKLGSLCGTPELRDRRSHSPSKRISVDESKFQFSTRDPMAQLPETLTTIVTNAAEGIKNTIQNIKSDDGKSGEVFPSRSRASSVASSPESPSPKQGNQVTRMIHDQIVNKTNIILDKLPMKKNKKFQKAHSVDTINCNNNNDIYENNSNSGQLQSPTNIKEIEMDEIFTNNGKVVIASSEDEDKYIPSTNLTDKSSATNKNDSSEHNQNEVISKDSFLSENISTETNIVSEEIKSNIKSDLLAYNSAIRHVSENKKEDHIFIKLEANDEYPANICNISKKTVLQETKVIQKDPVQTKYEALVENEIKENLTENLVYSESSLHRNTKCTTSLKDGKLVNKILDNVTTSSQKEQCDHFNENEESKSISKNIQHTEQHLSDTYDQNKIAIFDSNDKNGVNQILTVESENLTNSIEPNSEKSISKDEFCNNLSKDTIPADFHCKNTDTIESKELITKIKEKEQLLDKDGLLCEKVFDIDLNVPSKGSPPKPYQQTIDKLLTATSRHSEDVSKYETVSPTFDDQVITQKTSLDLHHELLNESTATETPTLSQEVEHLITSSQTPPELEYGTVSNSYLVQGKSISEISLASNPYFTKLSKNENKESQSTDQGETKTEIFNIDPMRNFEAPSVEICFHHLSNEIREELGEEPLPLPPRDLIPSADVSNDHDEKIQHVPTITSSCASLDESLLDGYNSSTDGYQSSVSTTSSYRRCSSADSDTEFRVFKDTQKAKKSLRKVKYKYEKLLQQFEVVTKDKTLLEDELVSSRSCYDLVMKFKNELETELTKARDQLNFLNPMTGISNDSMVSVVSEDNQSDETVAPDDPFDEIDASFATVHVQIDEIRNESRLSMIEGEERNKIDNNNNNDNEIFNAVPIQCSSPNTQSSKLNQFPSPQKLFQNELKPDKWKPKSFSKLYKEKAKRKEKLTLAAIENTEIKKELLLTKLEKNRLEAVLSCIMAESRDGPGLNSMRNLATSQSTVSSSCSNISGIVTSNNTYQPSPFRKYSYKDRFLAGADSSTSGTPFTEKKDRSTETSMYSLLSPGSSMSDFDISSMSDITSPSLLTRMSPYGEAIPEESLCDTDSQDMDDLIREIDRQENVPSGCLPFLKKRKEKSSKKKKKKDKT